MATKQFLKSELPVHRTNPKGVIPQFVNDVTAVGSGDDLYLNFSVVEPPQPANPGEKQGQQYESVIVSKLIMNPVFLNGMLVLLLDIIRQREQLQRGKWLLPNLEATIRTVLSEKVASEKVLK